jgi:hypothetical protein
MFSVLCSLFSVARHVPGAFRKVILLRDKVEDFPQGLKPTIVCVAIGTTKVVPCYKALTLNPDTKP